ncbi:hypothetical protein C2G38_2193890 [Gigaspora rosea]|uniref:Uncharacterized protein n=1 Tax=Gigaspora rosea TaxID=44941 RepID=A0A397UYQ0_9GLOM|nr:hypothetical protein C2G38_2193890 [Gigaspora rosea]
MNEYEPNSNVYKKALSSNKQSYMKSLFYFSKEKESQKLQVVKQIVEENYKWSNRSWKKRYHEDREATNHKKGHEVINHEGHEVTTHEDHEVTNYESYEVTSHEDHEIMKEKESQKLQDVEEKESQKLQVAKQIVKEKEFLKLKQIVEEKESQKLQIVKQIAKEKESQKLQEVKLIMKKNHSENLAMIKSKNSILKLEKICGVREGLEFVCSQIIFWLLFRKENKRVRKATKKLEGKENEVDHRGETSKKR